MVTKRDESEPAEAVDIKADQLPVRVELYDFVDPTGQPWSFQGRGPWQRTSVGYVWAEFDRYKDGDAYDELEVFAGPAAEEEEEERKPKHLYIKIKPVIDAPDPS